MVLSIIFLCVFIYVYIHIFIFIFIFCAVCVTGWHEWQRCRGGQQLQHCAVTFMCAYRPLTHFLCSHFAVSSIQEGMSGSDAEEGSSGSGSGSEDGSSSDGEYGAEGSDGEDGDADAKYAAEMES
jgi:hypothetical protein